jgi:hypothetical protein
MSSTNIDKNIAIISELSNNLIKNHPIITFNLIIFSHSDYKYLWNIIEDYISKLQDLNPIFISNKNSIYDKPKGFLKYIEYDDNLCYAKRWINDIIPNISSSHIMVIHDTQIIVECNINKIHELIKLIKINDIDRCSLNVFKGDDIIHDSIISDMQLCNLNNNCKGNTFIPYDVCPSIWKTSSFLKLWNMFNNETYNQSEYNQTLQLYCNSIKCYGIQKTSNKLYYCLGRPYNEYFKILFITIKGEIPFPKEIFMDMLTYFDEIYKKHYNDLKNVKINNSYISVLNFIQL